MKKTVPTAEKKIVKKSKLFEIPIYSQSEDFTSSAASVMMVLKYLNKDYKMLKEDEFSIWNETVYGSVWHGSRYGIAYALAKRGAKPYIVSSNIKDLGYERKIAVYEGINLDALQSAFDEIKTKIKDYEVKEVKGNVTINTIKRYMSDNQIPIVLVNANVLNSTVSPNGSPQWVVIKGYDEDTFYINDSYSGITLIMEPEMLTKSLGYEGEYYMILVKAKKISSKPTKASKSK
ncbi:peptidase C39-like superfamily protein [Candidatus Mancarchaeum acidiphilum]|uniref:Peptidase C39-like superfamily protein n=1 Tax=Candidatus Mancarchaeum acidiphilum TaxID=1920749 RepID=A0A218NM75_9ARCH|nr:peptidase C39 family protein [Candidatus Mancarchaeum acidiphilum]ASI13579.1 peptidase C39-like superfamily protein [Candidatus Mancarchaeum acidiphilum]